ncbi:MAG TPA: hypothetical protein VGJ05_10225 [Fimbriiglobus sp.]|jgi:hypothetical protein
MSVIFVCKSCGATLEVPDELGGRPVACGDCRTEQYAPGPTPVTVPAARAIASTSPDRLEETEDLTRQRGVSPFGKVAFTLAVLGGLIAAGAVAFTVSNSGGWTHLLPPGAGFEIDMPGRVNPIPKVKTVSFLGRPLQVVSSVSERKSFGRVVESAEASYCDMPFVPPGLGIPPILDMFANTIGREPGRQVLERRAAVLDGMRSLIVLVDVNRRDRIVYQLAIRGKRLFILAIAGKGYSVDNARVKKYFNSFHISAD